ncbi:hypothetical protein [Phenylobacterium sp.]|uniref:hypothetical protein n=1 Tax=Phenylobacterium sp. TaxID=1871053 RepID=UPI00289CAC6E|nr:hypothetical protein [Phenylobacterium sp.]
MSPPAATTSDLVDFKFPLIGFTPDLEIWGFPDRPSLTTCGVQTLRKSMPLGMDLIDADGAQFRVVALHNKGRADPLLPWLLKAMLSGRQYRIEYVIAPLEKMSLEDLKARIGKSLEAFPSDYCLEDERDTVLLPLLAAVQAADGVAELFTLLGLDSFESY